jgi:hypothetical protein
MSIEEFDNLFGKGQPVYFINTFDEVVFYSLGNGEYKGKNKGGKEFSVNIPNTKLTEAFLEHNAISKEEYDNF